MIKASRLFQVFAKAIGSVCNLGCNYCYYLKKQGLYPEEKSFRMSDDILEEYIVQHISASIDSVIRFSWHGGEPTMLGSDYFQKIVALQRKHQPSGQIIANGIQTNGTLLNDEWCGFLAKERFSIGLSLDGPQEMHDKYRVTKDGKPTFEKAIQGYNLLRQHKVTPDILCTSAAKKINAMFLAFP